MNFRLKKHHLCWSWKLYSSLNVTLTWPIHELHISRGNIFFAVDFLFDQWNQLRLMFFLLPFYTFHLESYLCHTNTGFLCMATGKLSSLTGAMQIHEVTIRSDLSMKKKNLPTDPFFKVVEIKESRKRSSVVPSLDGNLEEIIAQYPCIIISSNHHNIISGPASYFQNIDSSLLYCYIWQNDCRKAIYSKIDQKKEIC